MCRISTVYVTRTLSVHSDRRLYGKDNNLGASPISAPPFDTIRILAPENFLSGTTDPLLHSRPRPLLGNSNCKRPFRLPYKGRPTRFLPLSLGTKLEVTLKRYHTSEKNWARGWWRSWKCNCCWSLNPTLCLGSPLDEVSFCLISWILAEPVSVLSCPLLYQETCPHNHHRIKM